MRLKLGASVVAARGEEKMRGRCRRFHLGPLPRPAHGARPTWVAGGKRRGPVSSRGPVSRSGFGRRDGGGGAEAEVAIVAAGLKFWSVVRLPFERGGAHGGAGAEFGIPLGQAWAAGEEVVDTPELDPAQCCR